MQRPQQQQQQQQRPPAAAAAPTTPDPPTPPPPPYSRAHAAVLDNRAREVGIAVLDLDTATLTLDAFAEQGRSFAGLVLALSAAAAAAAAASSSAAATANLPRLASVAVVDSPAAAYESASTGGVARAVAAAGHPLVPLPRCLWDDGEGFAAVCSAAALATMTAAVRTAEEQQEDEDDATVAASAAAAAATHAHHRRSHYLAFGAAGALIQRAARDLGAPLAPRSLRVVYAPLSRQHALLDPQTVAALELLPLASSSAQQQQQQQEQQQPANRRGPTDKHNPPPPPPPTSVYAFLNRTSTAAGARLLRTALLQPLTDARAIGLRHGALEALLERPERAAVAGEAAARLPRHLDRIVGRLAIRPATAAAARDPARRVAAAIDAAVGLRALLQALPPLAAALRMAGESGDGNSNGDNADDGSPLLLAAGRALADARLARVLDKLEETLEEDAASVAAAGAAGGGAGMDDEDGGGGPAPAAAARSRAATTTTGRGAFAARINVCFAVKAGGDGLLDVARATFCRLTEAVHALADGLRADLRRHADAASASASSSSSSPSSAAGFGVRYSARLGFYLQVPEGIARPPAGAGVVLTGGAELPPLPRFLVLDEQPRGNGGGWAAAAGGGKRGAVGSNGRRNTAASAPQRLLWCTTHELNALNARLRDAAADCLLHAERALSRLLDAHVLPAMPQLLRAVDAASLADLLLAMGRAVSESSGGGSDPRRRWVRPVMLPPPVGGGGGGAAAEPAAGALIVKGGRHPLFEPPPLPTPSAADAALGGRRGARYGGGSEGGGGAGGGSCYVPNDVAAAATAAPSDAPSSSSSSACLHLVAGPNASGKTTYLRQVGVSAVLAQAGCFVPAEACAMRPFGRIIARFSSETGGGGGVGGAGGGNEEEEAEAAVEAAAAAGSGGGGGGASHFVGEMQGLARALDAALCAPHGCSALVLLDEPGMATGTADGTAVAWAAAERLLLQRPLSSASSGGEAAGAAPPACVAFVATHYRGLEALARCYPRRCRLWRMRVDVVEEGEQEGGRRAIAAALALAALRFRWRLEPAAAACAQQQGQQQQPRLLHYGVLLARAMGALPDAVTSRALEIAAALEDRQRRQEREEAGGEEEAATAGGGSGRTQNNNKQQCDHAVGRLLGGAAVGAVGEALASAGDGALDLAVQAAGRGGAWRRAAIEGGSVSERAL